MAGERTVKISFTGETSGLDRAAGNAEKSIGGVSDKTDVLATKTGTASGAFGALTSGFQLAGVESGPWLGAIGGAQLAFDTASGAADLLTLALESQRVKQIGATVATIAHSVAQKAAAVGSAIWTAAQWALNIAMDANPIGAIILVIMVLVGIIILIATKTTWFQTIWKVTWNAVKAAASAVGDWFVNTLWKKWIKGAWDGIVSAGEKVLGWFKGLGGKIKTAVKDVGNIVLAPYKFAFNKIADLWNGTVGKLHFTVPSWVPGIGGKGFSMPQLPHLARGGIVPATPGGRLVVAGEGGEDEAVVPLSKLGGETHVHVYIGDREITDIVRVEIAETNRQTRRSARSGSGRRSLAVAR